jgi:hypothetical protein
MKTGFFLIAALAFVLAGCEEEAPRQAYYEPLTSPGGKFTMLPPAVQNSVRAQAGMAEISNIHRIPNGESSIYEFYFKNSEVYPPLYVAPDGSVLTPDLHVAVGASAETIAASTGSAASGLKLDDLPPNVVQTIRHRAPTAEVDTVHRITEGSEILYEVSFKDPEHHPSLLVMDDGRLVK